MARPMTTTSASTATALNIKPTDDKGQAAQSTEEGLTDFWVQLISDHWGGGRHLKVVAELSDHSTVTAHVRGQPQSLAVPKDDDGNHIADAWEQQSTTSRTLIRPPTRTRSPRTAASATALRSTMSTAASTWAATTTGSRPISKDLFVRDFDKLGAGNYQAADRHPRWVLQVNEAAGDEAGSMAGGAELYATPNGPLRQGLPRYRAAQQTHRRRSEWATPSRSRGLPATIQAVQIDTAADRRCL